MSKYKVGDKFNLLDFCGTGSWVAPIISVNVVENMTLYLFDMADTPIVYSEERLDEMKQYE